MRKQEVAEGRGESASAWVNAPLEERAVRDPRLAGLAEAVAAYAAEHGVIGSDELAEQARADRDAAAGVRAGPKRRPGDAVSV